MNRHPAQTRRAQWLRSAWLVLLVASGLWLVGCTMEKAAPTTPLQVPDATATHAEPIATAAPPSPPPQIGSSAFADVISVDISGRPNEYTFAISVSSPDTGCEHYANWWEIITVEGDLLYRRILLHSHVTEQPFVRSGGPVTIPGDTIVIVRAHMMSAGYGGQVMKGSPDTGFQQELGDPDFAADLANTAPLPDGCAF